MNKLQVIYIRDINKFFPSHYYSTLLLSILVADMPGLIEDSHKNRGLGITFLKHAERCAALIFILDITMDEPWSALEMLKCEINHFNEKLNERPHLIVANKMDLPNAEVSDEKIKVLTCTFLFLFFFFL